jgi:hypothetical protein
LKTSYLRPVASLLLLAAASPAFSQQKRTTMMPPPPVDNSISNAKSKKVTTWWPDPRTGLMWSGSVVAEDANFNQAVSACSSLVIDGRTGWRLPAIEELDGVVSSYVYSHTPELCSAVIHLFANPPSITQSCDDGPVQTFQETQLTLQWFGNSKAMDSTMKWLWSSSPAPDSSNIGDYVSERFFTSGYSYSKPSDQDQHGVFCVRTMEPEVLAAAQGADVLPAVSNLTELRARVPLSQAITAYNGGSYQSALDLSRQAIAISPTLGEAYYGAGIAEAMLSEWTQATADLAQASKFKATNANVNYAKDWVLANWTAAYKKQTLDPKKNARPEWSDP